MALSDWLGVAKDIQSAIALITEVIPFATAKTNVDDEKGLHLGELWFGKEEEGGPICCKNSYDELIELDFYKAEFQGFSRARHTLMNASQPQDINDFIMNFSGGTMAFSVGQPSTAYRQQLAAGITWETVMQFSFAAFSAAATYSIARGFEIGFSEKVSGERFFFLRAPAGTSFSAEVSLNDGKGGIVQTKMASPTSAMAGGSKDNQADFLLPKGLQFKNYVDQLNLTVSYNSPALV